MLETKKIYVLLEQIVKILFIVCTNSVNLAVTVIFVQI